MPDPARRGRLQSATSPAGSSVDLQQPRFGRARGRPPQLAEDGVEDDPVGYPWWKVERGIRWRGMPALGATLTRDQVWQMALFLKHMDSLPPEARRAWQQVPSVAAER
jgi:mono/diheme cytochrome c family protein